MKILIFIFTIAALMSCAPGKSKHVLYGKWESFVTPKAIYTFSPDDIKIEVIDADGKLLSSERWGTKIIDERTIKIIQSIDPENKSRIEARIENNDELWIECEKFGQTLHTPVDYPTVCNYQRFKRLKE